MQFCYLASMLVIDRHLNMDVSLCLGAAMFQFHAARFIRKWLRTLVILSILIQSLYIGLQNMVIMRIQIEVNDDNN